MADVVELCADLIRFDTTNRGGGDSSGERPAAEYVAAFLDGLGVPARILEAAPGRLATAGPGEPYGLSAGVEVPGPWPTISNSQGSALAPS